MTTVSGQPNPQAIHLGIGWEIAVVSTFVLVIIAVSTVVICQFTRKKPDLRGIELENDPRSDKHWPASILNKKKRRRKKSRKKKARDPEVTTIDSEGEEIEEVESFEEDMAPLQKNSLGAEGGGFSGSGPRQQPVDVPKYLFLTVSFAPFFIANTMQIKVKFAPSLILSDLEMGQFRVKPPPSKTSELEP